MKRAGRRLVKAKSSASRQIAPTAPQPGDAETTICDAADAISYSNLSLHELFEQQTRDMLDSADIDEEQKRSILVAMACPCCGAGGMSFSAKLKR